MLGTALTAIIGIVARGKAAKMIASTVGGALSIPVVEPLVSTFLNGVLAGAAPEIQKAGVLIGATVAAAAVNAVLTYFAPKNAPAK